jgi:hypothetical protein
MSDDEQELEVSREEWNLQTHLVASRVIVLTERSLLSCVVLPTAVRDYI